MTREAIKQKFYETYDSPYDFTHDVYERGFCFYFFLDEKGIKWDKPMPVKLSDIGDPELIEEYKAYLRQSLIDELGYEPESFENGNYERFCIDNFAEGQDYKMEEEGEENHV